MTPPDRLEIRSLPPRTIGKSSQKLTADTRQRCREPETYMYPSSALNTLESDDGSCQSGVIHYPTPANERSRTRRAAAGTCILLPSEESRSPGVRECLNSRNQLANLLAQLTAYPTATVANLSQQQMAPRPFFVVRPRLMARNAAPQLNGSSSSPTTLQTSLSSLRLLAGRSVTHDQG
ncbi:uncharacterized protein UHOD_11469 [Ustilago sp. UG-2017b]|nr:uncharacterized protein UHOD_11469 [Ustilago sp. UG-2017b]